MERFHAFFEHYYPIAGSIIIGVTFYFLDFQINTIPKFDLILGGAITISSIIIAFLGTMVSILITLINTNIMKRIIEYNAENTLTGYISKAIYSGIILAVYSLTLYGFSEVSSALTAKLLLILFLIFLTHFLLSSFRIYYISIGILKKVLEEKKQRLVSKRVDEPDLDGTVWGESE